MALGVTPQNRVQLPVKKTTLSREAFDDFLLYKRAYVETFGEEIADENLVGQLVELALKKDREFKKYKARVGGRSSGGGNKAAPPTTNEVG